MIVKETFPNLEKDTNIQVWKRQTPPVRFNKVYIRHVIIKLSKEKEKEKSLMAIRGRK
jgi:hypothetical protein